MSNNDQQLTGRELLDDLWKQFHEILKTVRTGGVSHPTPYMAYEFGRILARLTAIPSSHLIIVHQRYCTAHSEELKEIREEIGPAIYDTEKGEFKEPGFDLK